MSACFATSRHSCLSSMSLGSARISLSSALAEPAVPLNPIAKFQGIRVRRGKGRLTAAFIREEHALRHVYVKRRQGNAGRGEQIVVKPVRRIFTPDIEDILAGESQILCDVQVYRSAEVETPDGFRRLDR